MRKVHHFGIGVSGFGVLSMRDVVEVQVSASTSPASLDYIAGASTNPADDSDLAIALRELRDAINTQLPGGEVVSIDVFCEQFDPGLSAVMIEYSLTDAADDVALEKLGRSEFPGLVQNYRVTSSDPVSSDPVEVAREASSAMLSFIVGAIVGRNVVATGTTTPA